MWGHFKHLCFKPFLMASWGLNWCFFTFPTKILKIHNSCMSATPKVGVHLGTIGLHPLHSPSFVKLCFTPNTFFWPHGPLHSTLSRKPNVKVATNLYFILRFFYQKLSSKSFSYCFLCHSLHNPSSNSLSFHLSHFIFFKQFFEHSICFHLIIIL